MFYLVCALVLATSLWVYQDATALGATKPEHGGFWDMSPMGWFVSCLLLWLIAFPVYLSKRGELRQAREDEHARQASAAMRKCPFCAEPVRAEAIKCRHCGSALAAGRG